MKKLTILLVCLFVLSLPSAHAQSTVVVGQGIMPSGSTLPTTCAPTKASDPDSLVLFYHTTSSGGAIGLYQCTATNTWTAAGSSSLAIPLTVSGATSGGIPCFDSTTDMNSSAAITVNDPITGGGAGHCAKDSGIPFLQPNADTTGIAIGTSALAAQSGTSLDNVAIGNSALNSLTTGSLNVAVGFQSIQGSVTDQAATHNTAIGYDSLQFPGSSDNTAVGYLAGNVLRSGGNGVFLGAQAQPSVSSDTNEIVIGRQATGAGSNTATIGNASVTDVHFGGAADAAIVHAKCHQTADLGFGAGESYCFQPCETAEAPTTLATGATTTQTGLSCLPANSIIDAVVARVTTTITAACTGWELGDGTTAARFTSNNTGLSAGTVSDAAHIGTFNNSGIASATTGTWQAAATKITITCAGGNPGAGAIRIGVFYHQPTAPTS